MNVVFVLGVLAVGLASGALMSWAAGRVVDAPVARPRSFLVGLLAYAALSSIVTALADAAGLAGSDGESLAVSWGVAGLFVALAFAWTFALGVAVLVVLEILWPSGSVPGPLATLRNLSTLWRSSLRSMQVARIMSRHGLSALAVRPGRGAGVGDRQRRVARSLVAAMNEAGVTFVKVGQQLSTRADVIPAEMATEMSSLQAKATPVAWSDLEAVVRAEGRALALLPRIEREPLAAASVGQVHRATLDDGTRVVVKIQRPDAERTVRLDTILMESLAARLARSAPWAREMHLPTLARGFSQSLRDELDYRIEADNIAMLGSGSPHTTLIQLPRVYPELSSRRVLVMSEALGVPLGAAGETLARLGDEARTRLARALIEHTLTCILTHGVFHADLHPGNILISEDGGATLVDAGSVGLLDRRLRELLVGLLAAAMGDDGELATTLLLQVVRNRPHVSVEPVRDAVGELLTRARCSPTSTDVIVHGLLDIVREHHLAIPPGLAAALRTLASLQGSVAALDPGVDFMASAQKLLPTLLGAEVTPTGLTSQVLRQAVTSAGLARVLPGRLESVTWQADTGALLDRVRPLASPTERAWLERRWADAISAFLAGVIAACALWLIGLDTGPLLTPTVRWYAFMGYVLGLVAFLLGMRVLFRQVGAVHAASDR
ncbi:AarF/ABC1/UbiB kinase family protein [Micrococcales bacterium 31B]|nr:AarF/ABC1/UbiB kinase family protein [Micrococcales bacterium 31B]